MGRGEENLFSKRCLPRITITQHAKRASCAVFPFFGGEIVAVYGMVFVYESKHFLCVTADGTEQSGNIQCVICCAEDSGLKVGGVRVYCLRRQSVLIHCRITVKQCAFRRIGEVGKAQIPVLPENQKCRSIACQFTERNLQRKIFFHPVAAGNFCQLVVEPVFVRFYPCGKGFLKFTGKSSQRCRSFDKLPQQREIMVVSGSSVTHIGQFPAEQTEPQLAQTAVGAMVEVFPEDTHAQAVKIFCKTLQAFLPVDLPDGGIRRNIIAAPCAVTIQKIPEFVVESYTAGITQAGTQTVAICEN